MHDMLILNGTVVTPAGSEALDVAVDGETIAAVGMRGHAGDGGAQGHRRRPAASSSRAASTRTCTTR